MFDLNQLFEALLQLSMMVMIGLYFIFSNTIMNALKNKSNGADVMVEINEVILNPLFMFFFMSSAVAAIYFIVTAEGLNFVASLIFLIGTTIVTMAKNVPLNNRLRDSVESERSDIWSVYLKRWVLWNHIRTLSSMSAGLLILL